MRDLLADGLAGVVSWRRLLAGPSGALHHPVGTGSANQLVCQPGNCQGRTVQGELRLSTLERNPPAQICKSV